MTLQRLKRIKWWLGCWNRVQDKEREIKRWKDFVERFLREIGINVVVEGTNDRYGIKLNPNPYSESPYEVYMWSDGRIEISFHEQIEDNKLRTAIWLSPAFRAFVKALMDRLNLMGSVSDSDGTIRVYGHVSGLFSVNRLGEDRNEVWDNIVKLADTVWYTLINLESKLIQVRLEDIKEVTKSLPDEIEYSD